ncbi:putative phenylalanine ammonia-lyase [Cadophora sp. DSE1049]|nr:putative phenylalanine ammonia-lyase [Cadophora sp. DSE1049]
MTRRNAIKLKGDSLAISDVVAVAQYKANANVDDLPSEVAAKIEESVQFLRKSLEQGHSIYGVNTGFGGSADTNTTATDTLQVALLQMQLCAINPSSDAYDNAEKTSHYQMSSCTGVDVATLSMPESWVRAAMLVRCNSLLRGHSAVRVDVIKSILKLLEHDLVPLVPLRGSVSASGDLCPLSYIAGALEGNPDVRVWFGCNSDRKLLGADQALRSIGMTPIRFGPKEILGLLNGTAFSVSVATLAQNQAESLTILAQILTAMGVEALLGTAESFDPFIAAVRPHLGQIEVARNIQKFLRGSKLAHFHHEETGPGHLRQDRYALRTSSQWLGPGLEDMTLSRRQLEIELNSTTDNPLIDVENKQIHHGGNFQASSVTSSTEKTRTALEKIGKMIFAQSSELLDSRLALNLPPNLAVDEPSLSYPMKGVDINMAAYMSELAYIANPVSNHVHSAEMSNQSLNSLALISARYTHTAVDLVSLMSSAYLYCLCQALDLRAMDVQFKARLRPEVERITSRAFGGIMPDAQLAKLHDSIWEALQESLAATTSRDSSERFHVVAQSVQHIVVQHLATSSHASASPLDLFTKWTATLADTLKTTFCTNRTSYLANPDAVPYLGKASRRMYLFVRKELGVPLHKGIIDHPTFGAMSAEEKMKKRNTGSRVTCIYQALKDGRMAAPILECLKDAGEADTLRMGVKAML